jgi:glycosyltransferase involved in cell wall biosynthesis
MITYNHEAYIGEAIESVLAQDFDEPIEIVIGEDCSPDRTREIVREYEAKYPEILRPLYHETNRGRRKNFLSTFRACTGDYIALLDADDFWNDPTKLRRQVEILRNNPDISFVCHAGNEFDQDTQSITRILRPPNVKDTYTVTDIATDNFIVSGSILFPNPKWKRIPALFRTVPYGDWAIHVLNAQHGPFRYIDEPMSTYRVHSGGIMHERRKERVHYLKEANAMARMLIPYVASEHQPAFHAGIIERWYRISYLSREQGDFRSARKFAEKAWRNRSSAHTLSTWTLLKTLLLACLPWLYRLLRPLELKLKRTSS